MTRRPWDDFDKKFEEEELPSFKLDTEEERTAMGDLRTLGKHMVFGGIIGGITGASAAGVELIRDPKAMSMGDPSIATSKVARYGGMFGAFFAGFHGIRHTLKLTLPVTGDRDTEYMQHSASATALTVTPMVAHPKTRAMVPYSLVLIVMDAISYYTDK